jgi:hypothetical protein
MSVEELVKCELVAETELFGENATQCHFVHLKYSGLRGGKPTGIHLSHDTAFLISRISDKCQKDGKGMCSYCDVLHVLKRKSPTHVLVEDVDG